MAERQYSFQTGQKNSFHWLDFVIFCGTLLFSAGIGIFYAIKDRRKKSVKDFLLAGGNMHVVPVGMSLLASFMSAITLLGTPAEMYNYTTVYIWIGFGYFLAIGMSAHIYVPVFYNLGVTSAYEYLEKRFSKGVRTAGTLIFCTQTIIYMAIVLYGPSLALNAVTGLSLWGAVAAVGIVCTFYTAIGGMKAVLWTDTFQIFMMLAGIAAALIQGCIEIGGFSKAWDIAEKNHRVYFTDFSPNPTVRHSFWSLTIGAGFLWASVYGTNQAQVQRALTCSSLKDAQIALWINAPGLCVILMLCSMVGIVMYAFYATCDPISFGLVFASDQLFPLFVMDVLGHVPGIPGLFVASIFSGALSTISSGLNSMAAVTLQDILKPYFLKGISESRATNISKIIAVVFGIICLGLTWVASKLGDILQAALSLFGMLGAPMLGLFTLGMLFPWANKWGAYSGLFVSLFMMFWIGIGSHVAQLPKNRSPISISGCNWNITSTSMYTSPGYDVNATLSTLASLNVTTPPSVFNGTEPAEDWNPLNSLYGLSYLWYSFTAVLIVLGVGLPVSFFTGFEDIEKMDPRLICPLFDVVCCCLPSKWREACRCGLKHQQEADRPGHGREPIDEKTATELAAFIERDIEINVRPPGSIDDVMS
ncbi:sodium-coupled monocarboxylate transporter 1-like [Haliotis cracherodii]|uniref:sodium-coupled monocarboxylate transporter 1-like n=1 Tax=Haliotis cracherodii TaxID=6455 RepID=UPI0039E82631